MPFSYSFGPLDEVMHPIFLAHIWGFPCTDTEKECVRKILVDGWVNTVADYPCFAGEIEFDLSKGKRPGSLKLRIPEKLHGDSQIVVNDLSTCNGEWKSSYDDLRTRNMPLREMDGRILAPLASGIGSTTKVAMIQINFIPGGCLLSLSISHTFADAHSTGILLQCWARHCRILQGLGTDRIGDEIHLLFATEHLRVWGNPNQLGYDNLKQRPELWHLKGLDATENLERGSSVASRFRHTPAAGWRSEVDVTESCIIAFTSKTLGALKRKASPEDPGWISTGDAILALLWRCIMKARFSPGGTLPLNQEGQESSVVVAVDSRPLLSRETRTDASYFGNVVFRCTTRMSLDKLLFPSTSLSEVAVAIRRTIRKYKTTDPIHDVISLAAGIPDARDLRPAIADLFGLDLQTTSWRTFPFYDADFGPIFGETGKPEFLRMPRGSLGGAITIHPRRRNGDVDVVTNLRIDELSRLRCDEEFMEFATITV